jgi:hypothetical protein
LRQQRRRPTAVYPGDIIPEQRAKSSRNTERHQIGLVGDIIPDSRATSPGISTEQWIKEGKNAIKWTRLSCRTCAANAVRLQLHVLAYNLGNFMRTLWTPKAAESWSLTSLREKLIKIGAKVVSHGRYVTFQMAEVAVSRLMFRDIPMLIARLRAPPVPA